jgi:hypothetical protein
MDWSSLQNHKNRDAYCTLDDTKKTRVKITETNEFDNGQKWISLSFYENHELTPTIFGHHLGNCNVLCFPENRRCVYGWRSQEIMDTLKLT